MSYHDYQSGDGYGRGDQMSGQGGGDSYGGQQGGYGEQQGGYGGQQGGYGEQQSGYGQQGASGHRHHGHTNAGDMMGDDGEERGPRFMGASGGGQGVHQSESRYPEVRQELADHNNMGMGGSMGLGGPGEGFGRSGSGGGGGGAPGGYPQQGSQGYGSSTGTAYGDGGAYGGQSDDMSGAAHHASQMAGSSGDKSLFSNAMSMISGNKHQMQNQDIDEQDAVQQHQNFYGGGSSSGGGMGGATSGAMGSAAAMQALKMFNGGGSSGGGGGGQNQFVGMAMAQASKLFDQQSAQGNTNSSASKQDAVSSAGKMAMKMFMKSEMGGGGGGLMSMASKFM